MPIVINQNGQAVTVKLMQSSVTVRSPSFKVEVASGILMGGTPYEGGYEVTPTEELQVLQTASRALAQDITVNPIPSNYGLITYDGVSITVS